MRTEKKAQDLKVVELEPYGTWQLFRERGCGKKAKVVVGELRSRLVMSDR